MHDNKKWSKDGKCFFNPETWSYHLNGKKLESLTKFIDRHKNYVDFDKVAERYAEKHGLDKFKVLAEWKEKGRVSRENGIAVHKVIENYIINGELRPISAWKKESLAIGFINDFFVSNRLIPIVCEAVVYNDKIATQVDCIAKNEAGENFLFDWKTNETIKSDSFGKQMLAPFTQLPDAPFYHMSLQVRVTEAICGYAIKQSYIVHFDDEKYNMIKPEKIELSGII